MSQSLSLSLSLSLSCSLSLFVHVHQLSLIIPCLQLHHHYITPSPITEKYDFLISGEAEQDVSKFLASGAPSQEGAEPEGESGRGHSLAEYKERIQYYRDVAREITGLDDVLWTDMFFLECHDIKHGLSGLAWQYANRLVQHLANQHLEENKRYNIYCWDKKNINFSKAKISRLSLNFAYGGRVVWAN